LVLISVTLASRPLNGEAGSATLTIICVHFFLSWRVSHDSFWAASRFAREASTSASALAFVSTARSGSLLLAALLGGALLLCELGLIVDLGRTTAGDGDRFCSCSLFKVLILVLLRRCAAAVPTSSFAAACPLAARLVCSRAIREGAPLALAERGLEGGPAAALAARFFLAASFSRSRAKKDGCDSPWCATC
jgi:hypothetical protein